MNSYENLLQKIRLKSAIANSSQFKKDIEKRIDYYYDRQLPYLLELISNQFVHADPLSLQPQFLNIVKPIINEISMIYRAGARRTLVSDLGTEVSPKFLALWEFIMQNAKYESVMKTVNRMVNLCRTVLVKPSFRNGQLKLDIMTPNSFDVIVSDDDPTHAEAIFYARETNSDGLPKKIVHLWDEKNYYRISSDGELIPIPNNPKNINPYGVLPFVRFTDDIPIDDFFVRGGDDLIVAQDNINIKLTQLNYIVKMQSFSVPVLVGYRGPERITISPGKPVVIPLGGIGEQGSPDFRFESPNPQIKELITLLEHEIVRIFRVYGISSADFSLQGSVKSGFALVMENMKLLEARENQLPFYESAEKELFEVIKRVWNYHAKFLPPSHPFAGVTFPDYIHLSVSINTISLPRPVNDEIAEWRFMLENKLATPIDYLMRKHKLTQKQARQRWQEVVEWWENNPNKSSKIHGSGLEKDSA